MSSQQHDFTYIRSLTVAQILQNRQLIDEVKNYVRRHQRHWKTPLAARRQAINSF
jgi:hypothetical protein